MHAPFLPHADLQGLWSLSILPVTSMNTSPVHCLVPEQVLPWEGHSLHCGCSEEQGPTLLFGGGGDTQEGFREAVTLL